MKVARAAVVDTLGPTGQVQRLTETTAVRAPQITTLLFCAGSDDVRCQICRVAKAQTEREQVCFLPHPLPPV